MSLSTPPAPRRLPAGILITVALLALYGGLACWLALTRRSWPFALLAAVAAVACVGTARLQRWSQFLVYLLAAAWVGTWAYSIVAAWKAGLFRLFAGGEIVRSLLPDTVLVLLTGYCCYAVFRQFSRRR